MSEPLATVLAHIYPLLHASSQSDVVFTDDAELTRFLANNAKRLAERFGLFVERDTTTIVLSDGVALYALPDRHLSTLHVSIDGVPLVFSSTATLEAKDEFFQSTAETAGNLTSAFYEDKVGANMIGFWPVPADGLSVGKTVEILFHRYPCDLSGGIEGPLPVVDYLEIKAIGEAYRKESDFEMPEVAKASEALAGLYEMAMRTYYGDAQ